MAKQPDDLVVRLLRDIQSTLADHTKMHADHTKRFEHLEKRLDDVHEGMITSLGLATHAHVRHDSVQKDLADLKKRAKKLETKV